MSNLRMTRSRLLDPGVDLDQSCDVGVGSWVRHGTRMSQGLLGPGSFVGFRCDLRSIHAGKGCQIASLVRIYGTPDQPVVLGEGVWVGARACFVQGVRVGTGAVIAAGSAVRSNVPGGTLVAGRPATVRRHLNAEQDGLPDSSDIARVVLARRKSVDADVGVPPSLYDIVRRWPDSAQWDWKKPAYVDAELHGGSRVSIGEQAIFIGHSTAAGGIYPAGGIHLGNDTRVGKRVIFEGAGGIRIDERCLVGDDVAVLSNGHDTDRSSFPWRATPIRIHDDCHIGSGATLVGPLVLGVGAIVHKGAVVVHDVASGQHSYGVFGG